VNVLAAIKRDHEAAAALLARICDPQEKGDRSALFDTLRAALGAHNDAEGKALYARLAETDDARSIALECEVEHQLIARLLAEMQRSRSRNSDQWMAKAQVLKDLFDQHVEQEEGQVFDLARRHFDEAQLDEMGEQMARIKSRRIDHAA
jgi:hemerythrin-like domain-containing protein